MKNEYEELTDDIANLKVMEAKLDSDEGDLYKMHANSLVKNYINKNMYEIAENCIKNNVFLNKLNKGK